MADIALDRSIGDALLKDVYSDAIVSSINQGTPFLSELNMGSQMVSGRKVIIPARLGRNTSFGSRPDGQSVTVPKAKTSKVRQLEVFQTYSYGTLIVTMPMIKAMQSDAGSFGTAVMEQTDSLTETAREEFDRMLIRNDELGRGILGVLDDSVGSQTTLPLTSASTDTSNMHTLQVDMEVDIVDVTDDSVTASGLTITGIVDSANDGTPDSIVVDSAVDTEDGNKRVVRAGSWKNEPIGLAGIVSSTGTLHGLNPVTDSVPAWRSYESDAGGDPIAELMVQRALDAIEVNAGAQNKNGIRILTSFRQKTNLADTLKSSKRFNDTVELKAGYVVDRYLGMYPILPDKFVPDDLMYLNNHNFLSFQQSSDWEWLQEDGNVLKHVAGTPNFEAIMFKYGQFVSPRRNAHGVITGLDPDVAEA